MTFSNSTQGWNVFPRYNLTCTFYILYSSDKKPGPQNWSLFSKSKILISFSTFIALKISISFFTFMTEDTDILLNIHGSGLLRTLHPFLR